MKKILLALLISSPLQSMHLLPSMDQFTNALAYITDVGTDACSVTEIINNARNIIADTHHTNPIVEKKLARLSTKINKNIRTLIMLSRQLKSPRISKKTLTLDILKTTEQLALYIKEFIIVYKKP